MTWTPHNIVALDQEQHALVAVINGGDIELFDPITDLDKLPAGGGYVVADTNVWAVRNPLSQSQYCWPDAASLLTFLAELEKRGYRAIGVANKTANNVWRNAGVEQDQAVAALEAHVHRHVRVDGVDDGRPLLPCGTCREHRTFDGGRPIKTAGDVTVDRSYGHRSIVVADFLRVQNDAGYDNAFVTEAIAIAWAALDRPGRDLLNLKKTIPEAKSPNRIVALACCTHDPATGQQRTHRGKPWGLGFITDRVIGLNGTMQGTGPATAGNPMRAVMRSLGRGKRPELLNPTDAAVRTVVRALSQHAQLPSA